MSTIETMYQNLLKPSVSLVADISTLQGDIMVLGAGGKMGPALSILAGKAIKMAGIDKKVIAVSRFSEPGVQEMLSNNDIQTIKADLLNEDQLQSLPDIENVLYMAGTKFGTTGNEPFTWGMNTYLPGQVAKKFKDSRIVVFSTGNVYPLLPVLSGGATELTNTEPVGEYAQSCLGRERMFQYQASKYNTPTLIYRLNYANDVSYGVLLEIAKSVLAGKPIDLKMGHINAIWQNDANEIAIRSLHHCSFPSKIVNVTGPETISVRWAAEKFGSLFGVRPHFIQEELSTALLSNASEAFSLFGYPAVSLQQMMCVMAEWLKQGGKTINKPTHFQERTGKF